MADIRVTYRRRTSYNTTSNKIKKIRTPGGRLVAHYVGKRTKGVQLSGPTNAKVTGIKKVSNGKNRTLSYTQRSIARPYGCVLSPVQLKERILKAFLNEEIKAHAQQAKQEKSKKATDGKQTGKK